MDRTPPLFAALVVILCSPANARPGSAQPNASENYGICESVFDKNSCEHPPPDVAAAINRLQQRPELPAAEQDAESVAGLGAKALPAILQLAGQRDWGRDFAVVSDTRVSVTLWANPYAAIAVFALSKMDDPMIYPTLQRVALGERNILQDAIWQLLVDKGAKFSLSECKQLFHSSFVHWRQEYGWPAILSWCLQLPPDQAVEALIEGFKTFDSRRMADADWKRFDQLLTAFGQTGSRLAFSELMFRRRLLLPPTDENWIAQISESPGLEPTERDAKSAVEKMRLLYDKYIWRLYRALDIKRDELALNSKTYNYSNPPDGIFRNTSYCVISFTSLITDPKITREENGGTTTLNPLFQAVATTVTVDGHPAIYEDGTPWQGKEIILRWKNNTTYASNDFSFMYFSTGTYYKLPILNITADNGEGKGGAIPLWHERIRNEESPREIDNKGLRPLPLKITLPPVPNGSRLKVTVTFNGVPIKDWRGTLWNHHWMTFPNGRMPPINWFPSQPLSGTPDVLVKFEDSGGNITTGRATVTTRHVTVYRLGDIPAGKQFLENK